jgi:hypothetical protein
VVVVVGDAERDLGGPVLGHVDVLDAPDGHPAGLHLVALHELTGIHELRGHAVATVASKQQNGDGYDCQEDQYCR